MLNLIVGIVSKHLRDRRGVVSVEWFILAIVIMAAVVAAPNQVAAVGNARLAQMLGAGNYSGGVTCSPNGAGVCGQDSQVTANISMNFNTVVPNLLWMIPQPMVLQQTASMTFENW